MRIGSAKNARHIAEFASEMPYGSERAPADWKYLGSGWSRTAYLGPDEAVYKVGLERVNKQERHNVSVLRKIEHPDIKVPACTSWTVKLNKTIQVVNAMEFIKGKRGFPTGYDDVFSVFGMQDGFGGNYIIKDGKCYIIDLGESRKRFGSDGSIVNYRDDDN
jgi:hypothetical protein